jgi:hypothetical protein
MADEKFAENPWSAEFWSLTRQGAYITKYGVEVAKTKAKQAGAKIGDLKPRLHAQPLGPRPIYVFNRGGGAGGGGGLIGGGSSGEGAPS